MFRHYLKTAIRNLIRKKLYTAINIFGLAIGLALCLAVMGHISYELSFEDCHQNKGRIYRVEGDYAWENEEYSSARVMGPLGKALVDELPEVEKAAVFRVWQIHSVRVGAERTRIINEYEGAGYAHGNKLIFARPNYLDVFTLPLHDGDPRTALAEPFSVLISEKAAQTYFPRENPIGQMVTINDSLDCRVTGILRNIPQSTQLYCDFVISHATLERIGHHTDDWENFGTDYAYLLIAENADPEDIARKIHTVAGTHMPREEADKYRFRLKSLKDIFFNVYFSGNRGELYPGGEASVIYAFGFVALFILIQAVANFINLSTARSADRMKEVGVRKVFGAFRKHLVRQFLGESIIIALVSMVFSVFIYEFFKLQIQDRLPRQMMVDFYNDPIMLVSVVGLILIVGCIAGIYPALYLSRFNPITVLQSKAGLKSSRSLLRKGLVVFQFGVAAVFIFCTMIIIRQTNFITSINLGFDQENIVVLDFDGVEADENCRLMKNEILNKHAVISATATNAPPGRDTYTTYVFYTDEQRREEDKIMTKLFMVDHDFISTFGLEIIDGRNFTEDMAGDMDHAVIISESAARGLGYDQPVGQKLYRKGDKFYEIVGVIKDFHGAPLNYAYRSATVLMPTEDKRTSLAVKLPSGDMAASVAAMQTTWETVLPGANILHSALAEEIDANYNEYRGQAKMFFAFAVFAIAIACLGIFGLVSYTAERRTKEIGIRKVLGAGVTGIIGLLSKEFIILIVIANALAFPIGYLIMQDFLKWFPFRISIGIGTFAFVGGISLALALLTAGYQSAKAALANPVEAIRCE